MSLQQLDDVFIDSDDSQSQYFSLRPLSAMRNVIGHTQDLQDIVRPNEGEESDEYVEGAPPPSWETDGNHNDVSAHPSTIPATGALSPVRYPIILHIDTTVRADEIPK